jgi:hypothetical protein
MQKSTNEPQTNRDQGRGKTSGSGAFYGSLAGMLNCVLLAATCSSASSSCLSMVAWLTPIEVVLAEPSPHRARGPSLSSAVVAAVEEDPPPRHLRARRRCPNETLTVIRLVLVLISGDMGEPLFLMLGGADGPVHARRWWSPHHALLRALVGDRLEERMEEPPRVPRRPSGALLALAS